MAGTSSHFRPALIVVDMQNDFCPPSGSLAVSEGREIAPLISELIALPGFKLRVTTQDWHPTSHVSFARNHPGPDNKPFEDYVDVKNWVAGKEEETTKQRLWPVHCVQGSAGANIIDEIDTSKIDFKVKKGMDERVEMYSVFADSFGNMTAGSGGVSHDLAAIMKEQSISHAYVVGLAGDYCVKATAIDAAKAGFESYVIDEATRCVARDNWDAVKNDLREHQVKVISTGGPEIARVREST